MKYIHSEVTSPKQWVPAGMNLSLGPRVVIVMGVRQGSGHSAQDLNKVRVEDPQRGRDPGVNIFTARVN